MNDRDQMGTLPELSELEESSWENDSNWKQFKLFGDITYQNRPLEGVYKQKLEQELSEWIHSIEDFDFGLQICYRAVFKRRKASPWVSCELSIYGSNWDWESRSVSQRPWIAFRKCLEKLMPAEIGESLEQLGEHFVEQFGEVA